MILLRDDVVFEDPQSRIREYCAVEIYYDYDDKHNINHDITQRDIDSANQLYAMIDRYDNEESKRLLSRSKKLSKFLTSIPTTNILHLKRPHLFPVLDSFVIKFLFDINLSYLSKPRQLYIGLQALERTRKIIIEQKDEFEKVTKQISDLPIPLTPARIFYILCWTAEKWDIRKNTKAPYEKARQSLVPGRRGSL
jgi:hypothetical protein